MRPFNRLIQGSRVVVVLASWANWLFLAAVGAGLTISLVFGAHYAAWLARSRPLSDVPSLMVGLRWLMVIGIAMALTIGRLLQSLGGMIASAAEGDPFVAANARRLQTIGWAILVLQLLDIPCALLNQYFPSLGSAAPKGEISIGGWMAVLMVFVLSRVFAVGSAMRDDLAGTV